MKVMLTPPDLWGSAGYVSQADSGAPGATQTMYKVRGDRDPQYFLLIMAPSGETQLRGCSSPGDSCREHHPHQQAQTGQSGVTTLSSVRCSASACPQEVIFYHVFDLIKDFVGTQILTLRVKFVNNFHANLGVSFLQKKFWIKLHDK